MEDNKKLFVFDKKEVVLIFLFIIVTTVTSFTLGVKFGKRLSLKTDGYTKEDIATIDMKSDIEETIEKETSQQTNFEDSINKEDQVRDQISKLSEEFEKASKEDAPVKPNLESELEAKIKAEALKKSNAGAIEPAMDAAPQSYLGKYTIQLSSSQSQETAKEFAEPFTNIGLDVIIHEAVVPGKGKWYRVGVGAFDSFSEAKSYLDKEKEIFQGKEYFILKIK